jgi:phage baseplate assembly protein W
MTYGSDFAGVDDIDFNLTFREGEDQEIIALEEAVARHYETPRGGVWYAPDYGMDLRSFIADAIDLDIAQALIAAEARKDERVASSSCTITVREDAAWVVDISFEGSQDDEFTLTFLVTTENVQRIVA